MIVFYVATKSEATQAAKHIDGAYRKVDGGWAVMDWEYYYMYYYIWNNQK